MARGAGDALVRAGQREGRIAIMDKTGTAQPLRDVMAGVAVGAAAATSELAPVRIGMTRGAGGTRQPIEPQLGRDRGHQAERRP